MLCGLKYKYFVHKFKIRIFIKGLKLLEKEKLRFVIIYVNFLRGIFP